MAKNVQIANVLNVQAIQIVPVTKHAWQTTPVEAVIPIINVKMAKDVTIANVLNVREIQIVLVTKHVWQTKLVEAAMTLGTSG